MAAALTFLLRIVRSVYDEWATMPAFIICTAALHFSGVFAPGDIDHHNVQLTLCLAAITALIVGRGYIAGIAAGAACALMLAVGMETLPYVAVAGMTAAATYLLGDRPEAAKAAGLGMGLAAGGLATFVATVPASSWLTPYCDAYSIPQFSVAATSGIGLAVAAVSPVLGRSFGARLAALLALGIAVAALAVTAFPQCLADPYAGLDPKLQQFWLNQVTEAQPFWRVLSSDWVKAAGSYVTPILALIVLGLRLRRHSNAAGWTLMAFLTAAFVVSLWQVRGATFSLPLAAIALAGWVGDWRQPYGVDVGPAPPATNAVGLAGFPQYFLERGRPCSVGGLGSETRARGFAGGHLRATCRLRPPRCAAADDRACDFQPWGTDPCALASPRAGRALSPQRHRQPAHARRVHWDGRAGADHDPEQPDWTCRPLPRQRRNRAVDRTGAKRPPRQRWSATSRRTGSRSCRKTPASRSRSIASGRNPDVGQRRFPIVYLSSIGFANAQGALPTQRAITP